jgi:predicted metal-dependent hydrolase
MNFYKKLTDLSINKWFFEIKNLEYVKKLLGGGGLKYTIQTYYKDNEITSKIKNKHIYKNIKREYGYIKYNCKSIYINSNPDINKYLSTLIDTISHELAHMYYSDHGKQFTKFKNSIKKIIKIQLVSSVKA